MLTQPIPSAEDQLHFLSNIQRVFAEGDFTATYKFALLIALADLAVELGADDGCELVLSNRKIGDRFIQMYWRQALPYGKGLPDSSPGVLVQNNGVQAAVISAIGAFRVTQGVGTNQTARSIPEFQALLAKVAQTVSCSAYCYWALLSSVSIFNTDTFPLHVPHKQLSSKLAKDACGGAQKLRLTPRMEFRAI